MPHGGLIKVEGPRILAVRQGVDVAAWGFFKPVPPALIAEDVVPPPEKPLVERGGLRFGRKAQNMVSLLAIRANTLQWKGKNRTSRKAFAEIAMARDGEGPSAP